MIGLLQRVTQASVELDGHRLGAIGPGLMVLIGVERGDGERQAERLAERLLAYRVFPDQTGRMNRSVTDVGGGLLLVPQFTLPADTRRGNRPSFTPAAEFARGQALYQYLVETARTRHTVVESGVFGADMRVELVNDGPVTFWLQVAPDVTKLS